jgi:hypothetical protein
MPKITRRTNSRCNGKATSLLLGVVCWLCAWPPLLADERPPHFFVGHVCRGSKTVEVKPPNYPCDKPVRGAVVTMRNWLGQVESATTDASGKYVLDPMPLAGTDKDTITFTAKGFVGLRQDLPHFDLQADRADLPGAVILLPKQRVEHVTIY